MKDNNLLKINFIFLATLRFTTTYSLVCIHIPRPAPPPTHHYAGPQQKYFNQETEQPHRFINEKFSVYHLQMAWSTTLICEQCVLETKAWIVFIISRIAYILLVLLLMLVYHSRSKQFYKINTSQWVSRRTPCGKLNFLLKPNSNHLKHSEYRDGGAKHA